jgi:DNA-binding PadR family transcriptional regulator
MYIGKTKQRILSSIEKNETYGYKLSKDLDLPVSTIYGHLKDFLDREIIEKTDIKNENGRIFYKITEKGKRLILVVNEF